MDRTKRIIVAHKGVGKTTIAIKLSHNFFENTQIPPTLKIKAETIIPSIAECKSEKIFLR